MFFGLPCVFKFTMALPFHKINVYLEIGTKKKVTSCKRIDSDRI